MKLQPNLRATAWLPLLLLLCGCLHRASETTACGKPVPDSMQAIRMVDFSGSPELKPYAERVREIGNESYPKIVALLSDDSSELPKKVDVRFIKRFRMFGRDLEGNRTLGRVNPKGNTVYISVEVLNHLLATQSNRIEGSRAFEQAFVHELAHVAQYYPRPTFRKHSYWAEGIADYVRYKLGDTNAWRCPECSVEFTHYSSGYTCTGAFLLYLDGRFGEPLIRQMNTELRHGTYSNDFFLKNTGKQLDDLWKDFQQQPAVKPISARLYALETALGFENGKAPRNFQGRFVKYVHNHPDAANITRWLSALTYGGKPIVLSAPIQTVAPRLRTSGWQTKTAQTLRPEMVRMSMMLVLYFTQAGGAPEVLLTNLATEKKLPGNFKKSDTLFLAESLNLKQLDSLMSATSRTLTFKKNEDSTHYNYLLVRNSIDAPWQIQKAWQASSDGKVLQEFELLE